MGDKTIRMFGGGELELVRCCVTGQSTPELNIITTTPSSSTQAAIMTSPSSSCSSSSSSFFGPPCGIPYELPGFEILICGTCKTRTRRTSYYWPSIGDQSSWETLSKTNLLDCPCRDHNHEGGASLLPWECSCKYITLVPNLLCWCCGEMSLIDPEEKDYWFCANCKYPLDSSATLVWVTTEFVLKKDMRGGKFVTGSCKRVGDPDDVILFEEEEEVIVGNKSRR